MKNEAALSSVVLGSGCRLLEHGDDFETGALGEST